MSTERILAAYLAWDDLDRGSPDVEVIDMLLVEAAATSSVASRDQVKESFEALLEETTDDTAEMAYLRQKLGASLAYLRALEGESPEFPDYIEQTLGVRPVRIDDRAIEEQTQLVAERFASLGYEHTVAGWSSYIDANLLTREQIMSTFLETRDAIVPVVAGRVSLDSGSVGDLDIPTEFVEVDDYWVNWLSADGHGFSFLVNTHALHQRSWFAGVTECLAVHEIGAHLLQAMAWKRNIASGRIARSYGAITIPGPESWNLEGLAETLAYWDEAIYDALSPAGQLVAEQRYLSTMVWNNLEIELNAGLSLEEAKGVARRLMPWMPMEKFSARARQAVELPYHRSYLHAYSSGAYHHRELATSLSADDRTTVLRAFYEKPMTPRQILAMSSGLSGASRS